MEWQDEGVILGTRRHGETSVILEAMTAGHGRHLGLVRGGRSRRLRPVLQPGNKVQLTWRARLESHLGLYQVEGDTLSAAELMALPLGPYGLQTLAGHLRLLPERDPHAGLYRAAKVVLAHLDDAERAARLLIRFELALLEELGFGLDLAACAMTGKRQDLIYVSPKSGRAVSRATGAPYHGKLLPLPAFLQPAPTALEAPARASEPPAPAALADGFALSLYFLNRNVYQPRGLSPPEIRAALIAKILRDLPAETTP